MYSNEEKMKYVIGFFKSGSNIHNYCKQNNLCRTSLSRWVDRYNANLYNSTDETSNDENKFYNITEVTNETCTSVIDTTNLNEVSTPIGNANAVNESDASEPQLTLSLPNIGDLHFSINQLKKVMEILK